MELVSYLLAALLGAIGLIFVVAAGQGNAVARIAIGVVLVAGAGLLVALARLRPRETTITHKIDLSGDVGLENVTCRSCGASLSEKSVKVRGGAIFIECEYCAATYQLEEEPKW